MSYANDNLNKINGIAKSSHAIGSTIKSYHIFFKSKLLYQLLTDINYKKIYRYRLNLSSYRVQISCCCLLISRYINADFSFPQISYFSKIPVRTQIAKCLQSSSRLSVGSSRKWRQSSIASACVLLTLPVDIT